MSPEVGDKAAFSCLRFIRGQVQPSFQALTLSIQEASCVVSVNSDVNGDVNFNSIFDNASAKTGIQAQIGHSFGWIELNKMDGYGILGM